MHSTVLPAAAVVLFAAAAAAQCAQSAQVQLQSTPGLDVSSFLGGPSLDPGPADYFDVDVDAGLTITRLGIVYIDGALGAPVLAGTTATVEIWIVPTTGGLNGGSLLAKRNNIRRNGRLTKHCVSLRL